MAPHRPLHRPTTTKKTRAKLRALKSLSLAILLPLILTATIIYLFGVSTKYYTVTQPYWWAPPLWLIHVVSLVTSGLMGLAAWMVWAEGGFSLDYDALPLYIAHVSLAITWDPLMLRIQAVPIAFGFCVVNLVTLIVCYRRFKDVNRVSGDLVGICLAWLVFFTFVNYKLMFIW